MANKQALARDAWPYLVQRVRKTKLEPDPFTYKELSSLIDVHHRAARWYLGVIQTHCDVAGDFPLQAFVVNARSGVPGKGYWASERERAAHKATMKRVAAQSWRLKPPSRFLTDSDR